MKWIKGIWLLSRSQGWFPASYVAPVEDLSALSSRWELVPFYFWYLVSFEPDLLTFLLTLCFFKVVRCSGPTAWTTSLSQQANQKPLTAETTARSRPRPRSFLEAPMPSPHFSTGRRSLHMRWRQVRATARSRPWPRLFGEHQQTSVRSRHF